MPDVRRIPVEVNNNNNERQRALMADPRIRDLIFRTLGELLTFPTETHPLFISSVALSLVVNETTDPRAALKELCEHMMKTVDEAITLREETLRNRKE
jgi:hypothetical protein